jgi:hypothetical protein
MQRTTSFLLLSVAFLFVAGCSNPVVTGPPRIEFRERGYDFGDVPSSGQITHVFTFKNMGGDTLIIDRVRAP